jgi:hypothetical protein
MPETFRITGMGSREEFIRQADEVIVARMGRDSITLLYAKGLWVWMV